MTTNKRLRYTKSYIVFVPIKVRQSMALYLKHNKTQYKVINNGWFEFYREREANNALLACSNIGKRIDEFIG